MIAASTARPRKTIAEERHVYFAAGKQVLVFKSAARLYHASGRDIFHPHE
jgi:hypothetical protein